MTFLLPGMRVEEVQTPALIVDLEAFEHNLLKMRDEIARYGVRHRAHCKMHKSADIAKLQMELGKACGVCCQKVSEAEALARAGIKDILVSNEVCDPYKIDRLVQLPKLGARILVCTDNLANITDLSRAAVRHGTELEVLVELDCGGGRCGVADSVAVLELATAVLAAPKLRFAGIQSYQAPRNMPMTTQTVKPHGYGNHHHQGGGGPVDGKPDLVRHRRRCRHRNLSV